MSSRSIFSEKIVVLAGGTSCEREISLISGKAVFDALASRGMSVTAVDPMDGFLDGMRQEGISAAFIALHGTGGEDGAIQRLLEAEGILYTGSGPEASERAFDKSMAQPWLEKAGVRVPEFQLLRRGDRPLSISLPCVVKPARAGSSMGVSLVTQRRDFEEACRQAFGYSDVLIVDRYIRGRELAVGILGEETLPIVEVIPRRAFYDYEAKYADAGTRYESPARMGEPKAREVKELALEAYKALGCEVIGRVDLILSEEDGRPYVLEVNTLPGLTGKSLLPKAAGAAGIDFSELCVKILELSYENQSQEKV